MRGPQARGSGWTGSEVTEECDAQARRPSAAPLGTASSPGPLALPLLGGAVSPHGGSTHSRQHSLGLQQLGVGHALQPVGEQLEGAALGQQHEQAVEGLDQVRVVLHVQQLQAQICRRAEVRG